MSGVIGQAVSRIDGPAKVIIGLMSLHVGKPWVRVSLQGSRKEFRKLIVRQLLTAGGGSAVSSLKRDTPDEIQGQH